MSLDIKYRPKTFDEILGQEKEIESFKKNLDNSEGSHSYIFVGPSGTGKTTMARVASYHLGAEGFGLIELNSADERGIDSAREIIEKTKYIPATGKVKCFVMNEVHGWTTDAKRALLPILENPPEHIYFFLTTTNTQKFFQGDEGKALKTRLTLIKIKEVEQNLIYKHVFRIVKKEKIQIEKEVIKKIAEKASGVPRTALKLLEKIRDIDPEKQLSMVEIDDSEDKQVIDLCRVLIKARSWSEIAGVLKEMELNDSEKIRYVVAAYMSSILLNGKNEKAAYILECFADVSNFYGKSAVVLACYQSFYGG